jgi:hypothetical protein
VFESRFSFCFDTSEGKHPPSQVCPHRTLPHAAGEGSPHTLNFSGSCFSSPSHRSLANYQLLMDFAPYFILLYLPLYFTLCFCFFISSAERTIEKKKNAKRRRVDLCRSSHIFFPSSCPLTRDLAPISAHRADYSVSWSFTGGRTPWTGDQLVSRPLTKHKHGKSQTHIKHPCPRRDSSP